jgi:Iap family predicted aminopeptidase
VKLARIAVPLLAAALLLVACSDRETVASTPAATATEAPSQQPTATTQPRATAQPELNGPAAFDVNRALAHIEHLASVIGPRVSGSEAEEATVAYITGEFEAIGYAVERFEFAFEGDPFRSATLTIDGAAHEAFAMTGSAGGTVEGPAVFVGLADAAGIAGRDLAGKIAVADRGLLLFSEKVANVRAAGAVALIVINNEEGDFVGNLTRSSDIPAVSVSDAVGAVLRPVAERGGRVSLDVPGGVTTASVNVIARAAAGDQCRVLVGGHHDTVPGAPGAHDNASGVGAILELARALAQGGLREGLCFVTFGGEESGLNGSRALADELARTGRLPDYMVNIDANGVGTRVNLIGTSALTSLALEIAEPLGIAADVTQLGANFGSDHQSFEAKGVPVLFFTSDSLGFLHTPQDTFETIDAPVVEDGGHLAYAVILELLNRVGAGG